jgi:signal transduction histidine kinase
VLYSNASADRLFGYERGGLIGKPLERLLDPPSAAAFAPLLRSTSLTAPWQTASSWQGVTARGERVLLEAVVARAPGVADFRLLVILRDTPERAALVEALADQAAQLARSNRDLEQFAHVAAHDLQEPLRMVGSYTQLVAQRYRGRLDRDADEFLAFATEGAARMQRLLDGLIEYSRVASRGLPFARVAVDRVLAQALQNLALPIRESGATIAVRALPSIEADENQLVELFQNLLGNAIKFRGPEPPRIEVRAERRGEEVLFSVKDNGIGIPPEHRESVFVIFQRLHRREEYPGTGIGLAICKRIAERHGGRIWVESAGTPGSGSTFFVALPARRPEPPPPPPSGAVAPPARLASELARDLIEERLRELA